VIQSEASFQRRVLRNLKELPNAWVYKAADRVKRGIPDLILCVRGQFLAIELKRDKCFATPLQQHTLDQIRFAGGITWEATPTSWPDLFDQLWKFANGL
jgi:Holliday junction resolvase